MRDPDLAYDALARLRADDFTGPRRRLWEFMAGWLREGRQPTYGALAAALAGDRPLWEALQQAYQAPPSPLGWQGLLDTLLDSARRRRLGEALKACYRKLSDSDPADVAAELMRAVEDALAVPAADRVLDPDALLDRTLEAIERQSRAREGGANTCFDLGMPRLTSYLRPQPGDLVFLAGETGRGKTAVALNWAVHLGWRCQVPTLYLNSEMSAEQLGARALAIAADDSAVSAGILRAGGRPEEVELVRSVVRRLKGRARLWATDSLGDISAASVVATIRRWRARAGIQVAVVDYIQRLADARTGEDFWRAMWAATSRLKSLAQELGILVILLAQLNAEGDLALSRNMLNDADAALYLIRETNRHGEHQHYLEIRKNRHGPLRKVPIAIDSNTLRVVELGDAAA